ncbi:TetR/AcrR family transcriptional regulator [Mycobacterium sherrisii]|uniref:TetR/AcrR family transcriptional regulator n=1 Tax=Mycobacterium sherrisii TaxID=243061 RepID=UPI000A150DB3|nr:TetR/AcrR family transcriptional regulator [Mycobacterium sherrisii]MCV7032027.1 TetR/AcrR family transcriptional regulator [Mycobacterium sherrisii]ORW76713.1 TetR family transcriptional regulator [Mycobacterium sherrisii]
MPSSVTNAREAQRLTTRDRLFDAAVAEIGQSGLAKADVAAIAAATGVARGTFYFHFPTKEHVLVELERAEEAKIVAKLAKTRKAGDLPSMLRLLVRQVLAAEERLGPVVFRDMLALHFSPTRPIEDETAEHPLAEFVIAAVEDARAAGRVPSDADPAELGVIFMTGLFALLATTAGTNTRVVLLDRYVTTIVRGMGAP